MRGEERKEKQRERERERRRESKRSEEIICYVGYESTIFAIDRREKLSVHLCPER